MRQYLLNILDAELPTATADGSTPDDHPVTIDLYDEVQIEKAKANSESEPMHLPGIRAAVRIMVVQRDGRITETVNPFYTLEQAKQHFETLKQKYGV